MIRLEPLVAGLGLLTRIPLPALVLEPRDYQRSVHFFPFIGALLGTGYALSASFANALGFSPLVIGATIVALQLWLTGALHEDGLADAADAIGGSHGDRERFFKIAKDSRLGTYGTAALISSLLLRASLYATFAETTKSLPLALIVSETLSRAGAAWLLVTTDYATPPGEQKNSQFAAARRDHFSVVWFQAGLLIALAYFIIDDRTALSLAFAIGASASASFLLRRTYQRIAGGVTGDFLGAGQQLLVLLCLYILAIDLGVR